MNTWVGENDDEYLVTYAPLPSAQDDGAMHTYRFDWHTTDPRVEFFVDDGDLFLWRTLSHNRWWTRKLAKSLIASHLVKPGTMQRVVSSLIEKKPNLVDTSG